jgi:D-3-phosphoglycerate dehydrogenase
MALKVVVADKLPEEAVRRMEDEGYEVLYEPAVKEGPLTEILERELPEVLIVRSTKVTGDMIRADSQLHLIIRAGAGYNTIDVDTASALSVYVANCPGKNAAAVAELTLGLIAALDRRIPDNVIDLREGRWNKQEYSKAEGLYGKTLGIVGTGTIGREVIRRAEGFGMKVIAYSRSLTGEDADSLGIGRRETPLEVAKDADIVSVHLAATAETRGLINREFFAAMKEGAYFINTSRADIVDEEALVEAVEGKRIRAGLDVMADEPSGKSGEFAGRIKDVPGIYCTHHIGASTDQAQRAVADEAIAVLTTYASTGKVKNCVNLSERTPAKYLLSVRHHNRVGVLSDVLRIIREADINVESMENLIFSGAEGACANIQIDDALPEEALERLKEGNAEIYSVHEAPIE